MLEVIFFLLVAFFFTTDMMSLGKMVDEDINGSEKCVG